jgi:hypothetical protein
MLGATGLMSWPRPGRPEGAEVRMEDAKDLCTQVQAAQKESALLAERLQASQRTATENWQLILEPREQPPMA